MAAIAVIAVLVALGVFGLVLHSGGNHRRPISFPPLRRSDQPSDSTHAPAGAEPAETGQSAQVPPFRCPRPPSSDGGRTPLQICIPRIRVSATVMSLGLNRDRTVQVPPLSRVSVAGWYRYSAQPGAMGPSVILGHVDSAQYGDGVFFELRRLRTGDTVRIVRGDGKVATFVIYHVAEVSKRRFPTGAVYGATSGPAIRLVTCGGTFDASTGNYEDNIIAYGTLQSLH